MRSFKSLLATAVLVATACACAPKLTPESPGQKDDSVAVTGVSITRASLELNVGEGFHLGVRISPKNATNPRVTTRSSRKASTT